MSLFLIHGLKFSGKSTIAERLMGKHNFVRVKMADPLKNMVRSLLRDAGISEDMIELYIEGDLKEVPIPELGGVTSRRLMQTLGDEWRNMHGELLWTNIAEAKTRKLLAEGHDVVIDDIRYPFEMNAMAKFAPLTTVVTRGNMHFEPFGEDRHPGERPMPVDRFQFHFLNDYGTREPLWDLVDDVVALFSDYRIAKKALTFDFTSSLAKLGEERLHLAA